MPPEKLSAVDASDMDKDKDADPELLLDVCELSVCLGNFSHNVRKSTNILEHHSASLGGYSELDLINNFQQRFEQLSEGADAEERVLLEARGNRFLQLYIQLRDLEPDEEKRVQYLMLFYELFDSNQTKLKSRSKSQGDLPTQAGNTSCRLKAGFVVDSVFPKKLKRESLTTISSLKLDCFKESTCCPIRGLRFEKGIAITKRISHRMKLEGYLGIEADKALISCCPIGLIYEKGYAKVISLKNTKKSDLQNPHDVRKSKTEAISSDDSYDEFENYIQNYKMHRNKSKRKFILNNNGLGKRSQRKPISFSIPHHISSSNYDNEYETETETLTTENLIREPENSPRNNTCDQMESIQCLFYNAKSMYSGNTTNDSESIKSPEKLSVVGESQSLFEDNEWSLNLASESWDESDQEMLSPIFHKLQQTVSNLKIKILKKIDKSLSVLSLTSQSDSEIFEENVTVVEVPINETSDNYEHKKERNLDIDISEECSFVIHDLRRQVSQGKSNRYGEGQRMSSPLQSPLKPTVSYVKSQSQNQDLKEKVYWQHQRHIIIAPRVVIQLFKSNPSYHCSPDDPHAPDFYEQVNQFFEIIGQKNSSLDARSIRSRLMKVLHEFKRQLPRDISYFEWVAAVGKYQLNQLLWPEEMQAYESLCWHLRDQGGQYPQTGQTRFTDALKALMGQESQHLKASPLTGRLQIRSPHHQESVGESYLLLSLGHLGYLYSSVKDQLKGLDQQGETAAYLVRSLRKDLLIFRQFVERKKNQPCSLLCLYWESREYQLLFQWLLKLLARINGGEAIIISLYEESSQRVGEHWRLLQMWLSEASKPLVSRLTSWLSWGQLTASDGNEFLIERSSASGIEAFWQQRYRLTATFSEFFNEQLSEILLSVGKTVAYSKKYLGRSVETKLSSRALNRKLLFLLTHFYRYGDQEPLLSFLQELHSVVSGKVLGFLTNMDPRPMDLFHEMHKYLMITDMRFYRQLMETLEALLEEPAPTFNTKLFNMIIDQMLPRQTSHIYVDKGVSQGSKCWSCFLLRLRLPDHWRALLGEDIKEYEPIFSGLWKFHYANYVLSEIIARVDLHFEKRRNSKYFDCIDQVDQLFDKLVDVLLDAMRVLKKYFSKDLLEPAYTKLRLGLEEASTLDDMLRANRTYLGSIKLGTFQTKGLRKCNMYLEQLYDCIMDLDFQERKFFRLLQNFMDYLTKYGGQGGRNDFLIPSYELTDRKREFCWSCQNSIDALITIKDQFNMVMLDLLFSLHVTEVESMRRLAQKLDQNGCYEKMDERLRSVQRFKFRRKEQSRSL